MAWIHGCKVGCELLSDFVYSFFEHNPSAVTSKSTMVVNCFQILYIRSLNTMSKTYTVNQEPL